MVSAGFIAFGSRADPLNSALPLIIVDPKLRRTYSRCVREVARGSLPDLVNGVYDYLVIDLASITYGLRDSRAFLANVRLIIDYDYLKQYLNHWKQQRYLNTLSNYRDE